MPALAITQPTRDEENKYSNVGFMGVGFSWFCSGTVIAPDVFLTAGHCLAGVNDVSILGITFDNNFFSAPEDHVISPVSYVVHPLYGHDQANLYDLALVFLPAGSTIGITPAKLTTAGLLDDLSAHGDLHGVDFTSVGYGVLADWKHGPPQLWLEGWRNYASAPLMALTPTQIYLNINEDATGGGGACYGDSGGPIFLPVNGEDTLVGFTTKRSDKYCRAMTTYYRLDTPWSREFLSQYVPLH